MAVRPTIPPNESSEQPEEIEIEVNLHEKPKPAKPTEIQITAEQTQTAGQSPKGGLNNQTSPGNLGYSPGTNQVNRPQPTGLSGGRPGTPMTSSTPTSGRPRTTGGRNQLNQSATPPLGSPGGRSTASTTPRGRRPVPAGDTAQTATGLPQRQRTAMPARPSPEDVQGLGEQPTGDLGDKPPESTEPDYGRQAYERAQQDAKQRRLDDRISPAQDETANNKADTTRSNENKRGKDSEPLEVDRNEPVYDPEEPPEEQPATSPPGSNRNWRDRLGFGRKKDKPVPDRDDIAEKEAAGGQAPKQDDSAKPETDKLGRGYVGSDDADKSPSRLRSLFATRRRKIIAGGGVLGTIVGLYFGFSVLQGPLQFIHMAQLLHATHLVSNEDAGDGRVFNTWRFVRSGFDPRVTRVGYLGTKMAVNLENSMKPAGIKPIYEGPFKYNTGFEIDRSKNTVFENMSDEEVKQYFRDKGFGDVVEKDGNQLKIRNKKLGLLKTWRLGKLSVQLADQKGLMTSVKFRSWARFGGLTLHPIRYLDRKSNEKTVDLYKRLQRLWATRTENGAVGANAEAEKIPITDDMSDEEKRNAIAQNEEAEKRAAAAKQALQEGEGVREAARNGDVDEQKSRFAQFRESTHAKLIGGTVGGATAFVGVYCMVKTLNDKSGEIKYAQVILPIARMAGTIASLGGQAMAGKDIDLEQLGYYKQKLDDAQGHSWVESPAIQAGLGQKQTGPDINPNVKEAFTDKKPFGDILDKVPIPDSVCGTAGTIILGAVSTVLGVLTGSAFSVAAGALTGILAGPFVMDKIAQWMSGTTADLNVAGPHLGTYGAYGTRVMANGDAQSAGGRVLSEAEELALWEEETFTAQAEFNSRGWAYKAFSPYDARSALSRFMDKNVSPSPDKNMAKISKALFNPIRSLAALPKVFSRETSAQTAQVATPYKYPFPKIGFSQKELIDEKTENPFTNAQNAVKAIEANRGYIDKAQKCFVATIYEDTDDRTGKWKVIHNDPSIGKDDEKKDPAKNNPYASEYKKLGCDEDSDAWRSIRMFIQDDQIALSHACYHGDEESCKELGFGAAAAKSNGTTTTGTAGPLTALNGQALAANPQNWIQWIAQNVVPKLPGSADEKAEVAARVTWWSLKEAVLDLPSSSYKENPIGYNNCAPSGNQYRPFLYDCPGISNWQAGISAIRPAEHDESAVATQATKIHGPDHKAVIAQVAIDAGYAAGSTEYNLATSATGRLKHSLLIRDPATGFVLNYPRIADCLQEQRPSWCQGYGSAAHVAKDVPTTLNVIAELKAYFLGAGSTATTPAGEIGDQNGDSAHIACAPGTVEVMAEYTAYVNGSPRKVRLCKVTTIPCDNEECSGGYGIPLGPGKLAIVNSQVSAAWAAVGAKAKQNGISLSSNSSLRTHEHQGEICRDHAHSIVNGKCVSNSDLVASQGHSPHESGTAMDLNIPHSTGSQSCSSGRATQPADPVWNFMKNNAPAYGILQYSAESWHWDTNPAGLGNRCS